MCEDCGCGDAGKVVMVDKPVAEANDRIAHDNQHKLEHHGIFCINIMGSPGSGKTTVIEGLCRYLNPDDLAVIQGDLESDVDKKRLDAQGINAFQINTHSGCHLNAKMVSDALKEMSLMGKKYLIIENVGNLVCPAGVRLGQHLNLVVSSTTEGSDKPKKYPLIFMDAGCIVISKSDLMSAAGFAKDDYVAGLKRINRKARIIETSIHNPDSFKGVADFIMHAKGLRSGHAH
ncbi:MAG: hydrogenase nickel incorporation protein HypB [archaeon]